MLFHHIPKIGKYYKIHKPIIRFGYIMRTLKFKYIFFLNTKYAKLLLSSFSFEIVQYISYTFFLSFQQNFKLYQRICLLHVDPRICLLHVDPRMCQKVNTFKRGVIISEVTLFENKDILIFLSGAFVLKEHNYMYMCIIYIKIVSKNLAENTNTLGMS